jgi:hypothetical protein
MGKPKGKQRLIPAPSQSTTAVDLFILAGLPNPLHQQIEEFFQKLAGTNAKIISHSSPSHDGAALYKQATVDALLKAGATFAIRRLKNRSDDQSARPRRITLFYVPSGDDRQLLEAFDFFVFPVPLRDLAKFDDRGHQFRHQRNACEDAIRKGLENYTREFLGIVQQRVESRKSSEPLLLPAINFHIKADRALHPFRELTRGARTWEKALPEGISPEIFDSKRLPDFLREQESQVIYQDSRDIVFPCARASEAHGGYEFDHNAKVEILRDLLQSTYRFGASLPPGFHHDAQFEGGRHLKATIFDCSRNGQISVTATHANIYPNDYVRPG